MYLRSYCNLQGRCLFLPNRHFPRTDHLSYFYPLNHLHRVRIEKDKKIEALQNELLKAFDKK